MNLQTSQKLKGPQKCQKCKIVKEEYLTLICKHNLCMLCALQLMQTVAREAEIDGKIIEQTINQIQCPSCKLESYYNKDLTEKYRNINQMLAFDQSDLPEDNDNNDQLVRQSLTIQNQSKKASNRQSMKNSMMNNNIVNSQIETSNKTNGINPLQMNGMNNNIQQANGMINQQMNLNKQNTIKDESNMFSFTQAQNLNQNDKPMQDAQMIGSLMKQNEILKSQLQQQQTIISQNESMIQPDTNNMSMFSQVQNINGIGTNSKVDQSMNFNKVDQSIHQNHFNNTMDSSRLNHFRNNSTTKGSSKIAKCAGCNNIEHNNNEKYMLNMTNKHLLENPDLVDNINQEMQKFNGYCQRHSQINELYCTLCKEMVCMNCHFLEKNNQKQHAGHTLIPIKNNEKEMVTACKTIRKNQITKQKDFQDQMDIQLNNIQKTVDNQGQCEQQLKDIFTKLIQQLQTKQEDYLGQVQVHFQHTLRTQQQILLNLQTLHKISQQYTDYTANIINQFNAVNDHPKVGMDFNNLAIFEKQSQRVTPVRPLEQTEMASIQLKDSKFQMELKNIVQFIVKPMIRPTYENSTHTNVQTNYFDPLTSKVNQQHATNHQTNLSRSKTKTNSNVSPLKSSSISKTNKSKSKSKTSTVQKK